ncbi:MAG: hypothetical protein NT113_03120 [Hyphomicrobiales bacterium]|nr:hypothetical protein [Hyphomicrobiales bacterium]
MTAMSNKLPEQEPGEIEALLPWHAAGTLNARDTQRVREALARDADLARQYDVIREEYAETIALNESLGAPSGRAMQKLFAAIDAEPARQDTSNTVGFGARLTGFFASLTPRTLMAGTAIGCLAIMLQAGVIGSIVMQREDGGTRPALQERAAPTAAPSAVPAPVARSAPAVTTRSMQSASPAATAADGATRLIVRFAPTARVSDITALLDAYQGTIVGNDKDGLFRLQFGSQTMTKDQVAGLIRRLENEKIVGMAGPAP